jgi:hypothetical protein
VSVLNCVGYLTPKRREPFKMDGEAEWGIVHRELLFGIDHLLTALALVLICAAEVIHLHELGKRLLQRTNPLNVKTEVQNSVEGI